MRKYFMYVLLFFATAHFLNLKGNETAVNYQLDAIQLYQKMKLDGVINFKAFEQAVVGFYKVKERKKDILTVIDFSKPSTEERLYVLDLKNEKLLFQSHVAHGRNSGEKYAKSFSNKSGSYKSSLGFYLTENTYNGGNGYSLILNGLEKNVNDKAKARAIVIHGADYANPSVIRSSGRLGRSLGCPSLPEAVHKPIINAIKDGSLLYIYANDDTYLLQSSILSGYQVSL